MTIYMYDDSNHKIMVYDILKLESEDDGNKKKRWSKNKEIIKILKQQ